MIGTATLFILFFEWNSVFCADPVLNQGSSHGIYKYDGNENPKFGIVLQKMLPPSAPQIDSGEDDLFKHPLVITTFFHRFNNPDDIGTLSSDPMPSTTAASTAIPNLEVKSTIPDDLENTLDAEPSTLIDQDSTSNSRVPCGNIISKGTVPESPEDDELHLLGEGTSTSFDLTTGQLQPNYRPKRPLGSLFGPTPQPAEHTSASFLFQSPEQPNSGSSSNLVLQFRNTPGAGGTGSISLVFKSFSEAGTSVSLRARSPPYPQMSHGYSAMPQPVPPPVMDNYEKSQSVITSNSALVNPDTKGPPVIDHPTVVTPRAAEIINTANPEMVTTNPTVSPITTSTTVSPITTTPTTSTPVIAASPAVIQSAAAASSYPLVIQGAPGYPSMVIRQAASFPSPSIAYHSMMQPAAAGSYPTIIQPQFGYQSIHPPLNGYQVMHPQMMQSSYPHMMQSSYTQMMQSGYPQMMPSGYPQMAQSGYPQMMQITSGYHPMIQTALGYPTISG